MQLFSLFSLIVLLLRCNADPDEYLPVYIRGIGWGSVVEFHEKEFNFDLPNFVIPLHYAIDLEVDVRGTAGATLSAFKGKVTIDLNVTEYRDSITLHSNGLTMESIRVGDSESSKVVPMSHVFIESVKESFTIVSERTFSNNKQNWVEITYRGVAKMDEYGLYENWDPKYNKSLDTNGPFVLATNNFPTGARYWFPCFDEPHKKATFELRVNHPSGLNAYSNTDVKKTERINNDRILTVFEKTRPLSTYQVALSINHLSMQSLDVKGFEKVRLIQSNNSHIKYRNIDWMKKDYAVTISAVIKRNLEALSQTGLEFPKEKLDIIILEGTHSQSMQPGFITIGRLNFFDRATQLATHDFRNFTQLLIGNRISIRKSTHIWLNDMFSYFLLPETDAPLEIAWSEVPYQIVHASLHEKSLRDGLKHPTSTKQFLASRNKLPSLKASQLLKVLTRFCPIASKHINEYIINHYGSFADIDDFILTSTKNCSAYAKVFLEDFIDQPGKALLTVKRSNGTVIIKQTRYHSTYFDSNLRDVKTRYTIPIFFTVDGKPDMRVFFKNETSITIDVPEKSIFLIDHEYDHLYLVHYENRIATWRETFTEEERRNITAALRKSFAAALSIGYAKYEAIYEQLKDYVDLRIVGRDELSAQYGQLSLHFAYSLRLSVHERVHEMKRRLRDNILHQTERIVRLREKREYREELSDSLDSPDMACKNPPHMDWDYIFNNESAYWELADSRSIKVMHCATPCRNASNYLRFLQENFLGERTVIQPGQISRLPLRKYLSSQWRDLHQFFFRNAGNSTNHRLDLLADTVLNQLTVEGLDDEESEYPDMSIRDDYVKELRDFVLRNQQRAASMTTSIEMRVEREFIRDKLHKWHNMTWKGLQDANHELKSYANMLARMDKEVEVAKRNSELRSAY